MRISRKNRTDELRATGVIKFDQYVDKYGYIHVRKAPGYWPLLHKTLWDEAGKTVPKGHILRFINGDKLDVRLDNLRLVGDDPSNKQETDKDKKISELETEVSILKKTITSQSEEIESLTELLSVPKES